MIKRAKRGTSVGLSSHTAYPLYRAAVSADGDEEAVWSASHLLQLVQDSGERDAAEMTEQETRAQRRRELNRLASERSRQKRKKKSEKINEELRRLEERNVELRRMADSLTGRLHVADRLLRIVSGGVGGGPQSGAAVNAGAALTAAPPKGVVDGGY